MPSSESHILKEDTRAGGTAGRKSRRKTRSSGKPAGPDAEKVRVALEARVARQKSFRIRDKSLRNWGCFGLEIG